MLPDAAICTNVPSPDTCRYPIIFPVALALGAMTYSMGRHLWTNPEVFPSKKLRTEGIPEEETNRFRAEGYSKSIFRSLQEVWACAERQNGWGGWVDVRRC
ncbi:hypothetical protein ACKKBG_A33020 [Auxenochlorella protothecoides x Auxenochlorella symbiontica]